MKGGALRLPPARWCKAVAREPVQPGARSQIRAQARSPARREGSLATLPPAGLLHPPPHAPGLWRPPLLPTPPATSLRSSMPLQKLQKFEETFRDPTVDPSGHLVHWARRKRCALCFTPAPNICPKVPPAVCPRPLSRCVSKVPRCLQSPKLGPELPN